MGDTRASFLEQIEDWEKRMAEAEAILVQGAMVLPHLKQIVCDLDEVQTPSSKTEASAPPASEESETPDSELRELRTAREVQEATLRALPKLPQSFTQKEVEGVLRSQGHAVNRSTLRVNLLLLARLPNHGIALAEEGRGRRATIFRKI
jgi:hypothetical protein